MEGPALTDHGWKHDDLAADLAQYLRSDKRLVWTDMQLGPSGSARPDVYTLERSYSKPAPTAYECKISRSDLRSDTTSGKWQKYLAYAGGVIFAVPEGLCTPADIPASCGLIVRKGQVWRHVRKATRSPVALPMDACMKLLLDGVSRTIGPAVPKPRKIELWAEHEGVRKKFGEAVARAARDLTCVQTQIVDLKADRAHGMSRVDREVQAHRNLAMDRARKEAAEFEFTKRELIEWLGIEGDASSFAIRRRIQELKAECNADARVEKVEAALSNALRSARSAMLSLEAATQEQAA